MSSSLQPKKIGSIFDREEDDSQRKAKAFQRQQADKRRELTRIKSMPASSSRDARSKFVAQLETTIDKQGNKKKMVRTPSAIVSGANNIRQRLLRWATIKTSRYPGVDVHNYSSSWADGLAFCALVHAYFPESFDFSELSAENRAHNFELAFATAEKMANADPLLDVDDMLIMGDRPDPKCIFTYLQSLYSKLPKFEKALKKPKIEEVEKPKPVIVKPIKPPMRRQKSLIVEESDEL